MKGASLLFCIGRRETLESLHSWLLLLLSATADTAVGSLDFSIVNHVMCITPGTVLLASATIMELNHHMRGVWNTAFVNFTTQLVHEGYVSG